MNNQLVNTGTCQGCMSTDREMRSMLDPSSDLDKQSYVDIFDSCFKLEVGVVTLAQGEPCLICCKCIERLNEAYLFKKCVAETQEKIKSVKLEPYESDNEISNDMPFEVYIEPFANLEPENTTKPRHKSSTTNVTKSNIEQSVKPQKAKHKKNSTIDNNGIVLDELMKKNKRVKKRDRKAARMGRNIFQDISKLSTVCPVCDSTFSSHKVLVEHMTNHYPNFICNICGKAFLKNSNLHGHLKRHAEGMINCQLCNKMLKKSSLRHHMLQHQGIRPHSIKCDVCNLSFASDSSRKTHMKEVHNREIMKYPCDICGNCYASKCTLKNHRESVHEKKVNATCNVCNKGFFNQYKLKNHMLKHTGIREHTCEICQKSFLKKYTLQEHMKIHNNVKNFVCSICNKAFTYKCSLKGHLNSHHPDVKVKF